MITNNKYTYKDLSEITGVHYSKIFFEADETYTYDALGRRVAKSDGTDTTSYLYDGDQVIAEYDTAGTQVARYVYGQGIDEPISMTRGTETYYYHFDGLGSVIGLTDSSGAKVEEYSYDIFGKTNLTSVVHNPYMFTGRRFDPESGLYYYRARMYSPTLGRFLQTDPIGYFDSMNLYQYCGNNPVNFVDPMGLTIYSIDISEKNIQEKQDCVNGYLDSLNINYRFNLISMLRQNGIEFLPNGYIRIIINVKKFSLNFKKPHVQNDILITVLPNKVQFHSDKSPVPITIREINLSIKNNTRKVDLVVDVNFKKVNNYLEDWFNLDNKVAREIIEKWEN